MSNTRRSTRSWPSSTRKRRPRRSTSRRSPAEPAPKPAEEPAKPAEAAKPAEEKPAEAKPAEPPKPDEAKPAEKTPEQIGAEAAEAARVEAERHDYTKLEIPKELVADDERMGQAIDLLKEWKVPVEAGKKLLDLHTSTLKEFAENVARHSLSEQHRIFGETRKKWTQEVLADPELGGAGHQTAMAQIAKVRDMMVPESERAKFGEFLAVTGAGDNPTFLRALYRASKFMNEPGMPPPNPAPVPGNGKSPNKRAVLYDHPTSQAGSRQ